MFGLRPWLAFFRRTEAFFLDVLFDMEMHTTGPKSTGSRRHAILFGQWTNRSGVAEASRLRAVAGCCVLGDALSEPSPPEVSSRHMRDGYTGDPLGPTFPLTATVANCSYRR